MARLTTPIDTREEGTSRHQTRPAARGPAIALVMLLAAITVQPAVTASIPQHPGGHDLDVTASIDGLESRTALITRSAPVLQLRVTNRAAESVRVLIEVAVVSDGTARRFRVGRRTLPARGTLTQRLTLPASALPPNLRFSGRATVSLEIEPLPSRTRSASGKHEVEGQTLPAIHFHRDRGLVVFYREDVLRERFGAGNFRHLPLQVPDPLPGLRQALREARLDLRPVLSTVGQRGRARRGVGGFVTPGARRFCFVMDGIAYGDSSRNYLDFGEDIGRAGDTIPVSRGWVSLGQLGSPVFTGFLDGSGCTPNVVAAPGIDLSVAFSPIYLQAATNLRGFVSDLNLGPQWPDSMPFFLFFIEPIDAAVNVVPLDSTDYVHTIFAAAANALERVPGGLTNVLYEFRLREAGDNSGTNTFYAAEGHPQVRIKYSSAAVSKFTIAHEYGHALSIAALAPPLTPADLDYSVTDDQAEQHTLTSKEWQLTAAFEGFGHFVAAAVWNDAGPGADGVFVDGGSASPGNNTSYPLDQFDQRFLDNFDPDLYPGQGVELDWAQFFWAYHTNTVGPAPPVDVLLDVWLASYPWTLHEGFFDDFVGGAEDVLAGWELGTSLADKLDRLADIAEAAGIVP